MSRSYFSEYAIYSTKSTGYVSIPQINVYYGGASNSPGAILRFAKRNDPNSWLSFTAGETFTDDMDQQILGYIDSTDNRMYKVHTSATALDSIDSLLRSKNMFIVDMSKESSSVVAGGTLSYCYPFIPLSPNKLYMRQVSGVEDVYVEMSQSVIHYAPVIGSIGSQDGCMWFPSSLFQSATVSGTNEISGYTATDGSAAVQIDNGSDLTGYAAVDGVAQYALIMRYTTGIVSVMGYIGAVTLNGGTAYDMTIFSEASCTTQTWLGGTTDKTQDYATNADLWYIVPVENAYDGETCYAADDLTTNAVVEFSSEQTGIVRTETSIAGTDVLWYADYDSKLPIPESNSASTWVAGTDYALKSKGPLGNAIVLKAKAAGNEVVISGEIEKCK